MKCWKQERRPVSEQQHTDRLAIDDDDMDSNTVTESDMDQSSKDAMQDSNKHSLIWAMFMSSTLEAFVFMGKSYSDNSHSVKNTEDLTLKQMFEISEKLIVGQSDEINGVTPIDWEDFSWKQMMKKSSVSRKRRFT